MTPRQKITLVVSVIVVAVLVIAGSLTRKKGEPKPGPEPGNETEKVVLQDEKDITVPATTEEEKIFIPEVPRFAVPTKPIEETTADEESGAMFGTFRLAINKYGYEPNSITVKQGDVVQIEVSAIDEEYDFSIPYNGIYQAVKKGETKTVSFRAFDAGTLSFKCRDYCPESGEEGKFIVIP